MPPEFHKLSAEKIIQMIRTKDAAFWERQRESTALSLFHRAAVRVPAYKDFLKKNRIQHEKIRTFKDFQFVPSVDKKNYLRKYPLEKLVWDGSLKESIVFTSTSGSTGNPFYFPRGERLDWEYSILAELFLKNSSYKSNGPKLVIVALGMGAWIGGLITYKAFEIASLRGKHRVSIITPGINKAEIFHALKELAPHYQETTLVGYPPFVKDVIDEAIDQGINFKKLNFRMLTAAEAYTEKFRDHIVQKTGIRNIFKDTLNIYGTADIGAMAWETPTTILIRRLAIKNKKIFKEIFLNIEKTPTLAQYNPFFITFEVVGEEILLSGSNTIPLIRYSVGDHGGGFSYDELISNLNRNGVDFNQEARRFKLEDVIYQLPFVYVYERHDFSTKLYGAIIYPEPIREALHDSGLNKYVTGRFTMVTKFSRWQNEFLEIHIELRKNIKPKSSLKRLCGDLILKSLLEKNSEYRNNYTSMPKKMLPKITFWPYEHPHYFKPGVKQKWVKKD